MTPLWIGLGFATAAGWNAWAVLLVYNALFRLLPPEFAGSVAAFLASQAVLQISAVLFLAEFLIGKIPLVDRFWEFAQTLLRPLVGALLALTPVSEMSTAARVGVALLAGIVTLASHATKSATRLTSTAATRGFAQLALSLAEDVIAVLIAILCFFQPWLTLLFLAGLVLVLLMHWPRVARGLQVLFFRIQHPRRRMSSE